MNIFDLLADWNIKKWLERPDKKAEGNRYETESESDSKGATDFGKPYEGHLLDDIKAIIVEAYMVQDDEAKSELLLKARKLETQLLMSYEKQGYNMLAVSTQQLLRDHERKVAAGKRSRHADKSE